MPGLTDVLATIKDEGQRKQLETLCAANPELSATLTLSDQVKARETELKTAKEEWARSRQTYDAETERVRGLGSKYEELLKGNPPAAPGAAPVVSMEELDTPEKVVEYMRSKGGLATKEDIEAAAKKLREDYEKAQPVNLMANAIIANLIASHQREFGEPLDTAVFNKFMAENPRSFTNVQAAYDSWDIVRNKRADKLMAEKAVEIEKRVREDERAKVLAANPGLAPGAPPVGYTPPALMGNLERRVRRPDDIAHLKGLSLSGTPGGGSAAALAAEELRKEGKDQFIFSSEIGTISAGAAR